MRRFHAVAACVGAALLLAPPTASAARIYAVEQANDGDYLTAFDSNDPSDVVSRVPITGVGAGEASWGLDWRPATGEFVLLTMPFNAGSARLYDLDSSTGEATSPRALTADPGDTTSPFTVFGSITQAMDVDPEQDELRVVAVDAQNLRVDIESGQTTTETPVTPDEDIAAGAFTNVDADAATPSTLFGYGFASDNLFLQQPQDAGTLTLLGPTGIISTSSGTIGMDIAPDGGAFLTSFVGGAQNLYTLSLSDGAASLIGPAPADTITGMAAVNNVVRVTDASIAVPESAGSVRVIVARDAPFDSASVNPTVQASTASGTATAADFSPTATAMGFGPGSSAVAVTVPIIDDAVDEPDETFQVQIDPASDTPVAAPRVAEVTIADDDPTVVTETKTETTTQTQTVTVDRPVTVVPPPATLLPGRCANARDGTSADDALGGTTAGDRLRGLGGADGLAGLGGDDCLDGGAGSDLLSGGDGADELKGGSGENVVFGGAGADAISVRNRRRDVVDCGGGRDRVVADPRDRLRRCERVRRR